jgi:hypothetical protein
MLFRYEFGDCACSDVVEAGIDINKESGSIVILPPDFATMLLENPKYFCNAGGRIICGVYMFALFKSVHAAPAGYVRVDGIF